MAKYFWYAAVILLIGALYFAFETGFLMYMWQADISKLTLVILSIFTYSFSKLGYLLHTSKSVTIDGLVVKVMKEADINDGFEWADSCMAWGMLGTVVGFIVMTNSFAGVDINDIQNIKQLFSLATTGMSTALLTTATGLTSSIILRTSYYLTGKTHETF